MSSIESEKSIHIRQPAYLPGLVYFDQLLQVQTHVIYDNVQYERRHFGNRNKLRSSSHPDGWQWITVPVLQKGKREQWYSDTEIDNSKPWAKDHWKAILYNYSAAPHFKRYADFFESLYKNEWKRLIDLDLTVIRFIQTELKIPTQLILASQLKTGFDYDDKNQRLINIVKELGGTTYVTVMGTKEYINPGKFRQAGITLLWHQFEHPIYPQFQGEFIPSMSAVDLLFNCGQAGGEILKASSQKPVRSPL